MAERKRKPRNKNWISLENASKIAQEGGCKSRKQYFDWHARNGISDIPKQPDRVYPDWEGWPAFLGTKNIFLSDVDKFKAMQRPYWEAVRWSQVFCSEHNITTGLAWQRFFIGDRKDGTNLIPEDIPKHPDYVYKDEWTGWPAWLGKHLRDKIDAQRRKLALVCIATATWRPANVIQMIVANDGESQLLEILYQKQLRPLKIYTLDRDKITYLEQVLQHVGSNQHDGSWIIRDMNYLISEFDFTLDRFVTTRPDVYTGLYTNKQDISIDVDDKNHSNQMKPDGSGFV